MARKKSQRYPSQKKYDESHPIVSFRLTREEYDLVQEIADIRRMTVNKIARKALLSKSKEIKKVYNDGLDDGWKQASLKYKITYPCCICKEKVVLERGNDDTELAIEYLIMEGWGHDECIEE